MQKLGKKFLGMVLAGTLSIAMGITAFATPSPEKNAVVTEYTKAVDKDGKNVEIVIEELTKEGKTAAKLLQSKETLKDIIGETKFAASDKETRPILTGINFKAHDHVLEVVATDSYRLAKKIISIDEDVTFNITIPKLSLDEISKIIEKDELIELYVSERKVLFVFDKNIIQTRLIDGSYPDTARLIPLEFDYELDINRADLLNAIDRVSLLLNEQNNIVKLDMSNEQVILSSYQQEIGSVEENLASSFYKGEPLTISFSCKYASDAIKSFSGDKIKILLE